VVAADSAGAIVLFRFVVTVPLDVAGVAEVAGLYSLLFAAGCAGVCPLVFVVFLVAFVFGVVPAFIGAVFVGAGGAFVVEFLVTVSAGGGVLYQGDLLAFAVELCQRPLVVKGRLVALGLGSGSPASLCLAHARLLLLLMRLQRRWVSCTFAHSMGLPPRLTGTISSTSGLMGSGVLSVLSTGLPQMAHVL
jgi:hypothetical protein